jgi:cell division protein FtsB
MPKTITNADIEAEIRKQSGDQNYLKRTETEIKAKMHDLNELMAEMRAEQIALTHDLTINLIAQDSITKSPSRIG